MFSCSTYAKREFALQVSLWFASRLCLRRYLYQRHCVGCCASRAKERFGSALRVLGCSLGCPVPSYARRRGSEVALLRSCVGHCNSALLSCCHRRLPDSVEGDQQWQRPHCAGILQVSLGFCLQLMRCPLLGAMVDGASGALESSLL
jgi:hypothetical protein